MPHWQSLHCIAPTGLFLVPDKEQSQDIRITMLKNRDGELVQMRTGDVPKRPVWAALLDRESHGP